MTPSLRARLPSTATRCCGALDAMHEILQFERVIQGERIPILLSLDLTLSPKIIVHCDNRVSDKPSTRVGRDDRADMTGWDLLHKFCRLQNFKAATMVTFTIFR